MAGRHGYAALTNALAPVGPAQMTAINAFWDERLSDSRADSGAFPTYSDKPRGYQIVAEDTDAVYLRGASNWRKIFEPDAVATLTPETGYVIGGATDVISRLGLVNAVLSLSKTSGNFTTNTDIATIPAGFRPAGDVSVACAFANATTGWLRINSSGLVRIFFTGAASNAVYAVASYRVA